MKKIERWKRLMSSLFVLDPGVTTLVEGYLTRISVDHLKWMVVLFLVATKVHTLDHDETNQWWMDTFNNHVNEEDMFGSLQEFNQYERRVLDLLEWRLLDGSIF